MLPFPAPSRVEDQLGFALNDVSPAKIEAAVDDGVAESDQLDWKREHYERTDEGRFELAKDVAAFANHQGGVLVIGVADVNGIATASMPVTVGDAIERQLRQTIAARLLPLPEFHIVSVPADVAGANGHVIIVVSRSMTRPHAVMRPNEQGLHYPVRFGAQTRWMAEPEVAEAYRRRDRVAGSQRARVDELRDELEIELSLGWWLTVTVVPDHPGRWPVDLATVEMARQAYWHRDLPLPLLSRAEFPQLAASRVGAVLLGHNLDREAGTIMQRAALLADDGSACVSVELNWEADEDGTAPIYDETLTASAAQALAICSQHTSDAGAGDLLLISARLSRIDGADVPDVALAHTRAGGGRYGSSHLSAPTRSPVSSMRRPVGATRLLIATREALAPVLQSFGHAESYQIATDGQLRRPYWSNANRGRLEGWADANNVNWTDDAAGGA
jgi:hypothetical protein